MIKHSRLAKTRENRESFLLERFIAYGKCHAKRIKGDRGGETFDNMCSYRIYIVYFTPIIIRQLQMNRYMLATVFSALKY